eukprot:4158296-Pyramimonas_sp.AAC.1
MEHEREREMFRSAVSGGGPSECLVHEDDDDDDDDVDDVPEKPDEPWGSCHSPLPPAARWKRVATPPPRPPSPPPWEGGWTRGNGAAMGQPWQPSSILAHIAALGAGLK